MKIYEQDEKKVVIRLDELAVAMRADEDPDSSYEENPEYEQEWEMLSGELDDALNRYIARARKVSPNGVNLFGVRRIVVDAAQTNLHVTISDDGKLVCLDTVDKVGRAC